MLGDRVRAARLAAGLTQERLSALTGLKQFHISRIESGDIKDVRSDTLKRLARALRVSTDALLEFEGEQGASADSECLTAVAS